MDSNSICLEFKGQILPDLIKIWRFNIPIQPYIPSVRICYKCDSIGHMSKACDKEEKCLNCGKVHIISKENRCTAQKYCINCGCHFTLDKRCSAYIRHSNILKIMAINNISFSEARKLVNGLSNNLLHSSHLLNPSSLYCRLNISRIFLNPRI